MQWPVKNSRKTDGYRARQLIFYVSSPPPLSEVSGSATVFRRRKKANLMFRMLCWEPIRLQGISLDSIKSISEFLPRTYDAKLVMFSQLLSFCSQGGGCQELKIAHSECDGKYFETCLAFVH